ncbi:MAG TPA: phosphoglycerate mutase family protein, partial [Candidatus Marinimicrobia bacterium]|nr:phosphoglycerate mutase family protein [Candidatus Neomarinimicrobiota bacterium]
GSEYSPLQIGSTQTFSAIRLEEDGTQLLYKYNMRNGKGEVLVPDLKIGYHSWIDRNRVLSFVLDDPPTLQLSYLIDGENRVLDSTIGRSLHPIPGKSLMSYVSKQKEPWSINSIHPETGEIDFIMNTLDGSEDYAWTPSGTIIMGKEVKLYKFDPDRDSKWVEIGDLSNSGLSSITRLAVSPKGDKIAVVAAEEACRPAAVYLFRHAEKMIIPGEDDPDLTSEGFKRAEALALAMSDIEAGAVYSSQYKRTRQTIAPLSKAWSVEAAIIPADDPEKQIDVLFYDHCGENVVISGHSNTLPNLIKLLDIPEKIMIEDDQYGDLYVVLWKDGIPTLTIDHVGN